MFPFRSLIVLCSLLISITLFGQQHPQVSHSQIPQWVQPVRPDLSADNPVDQSSGVYYILVDNQDYLASDQFYRRMTYRIKNSMGTQQLSDLMVNFDPAYQNVEIHTIKIIRDGKTIDKLDLDKIKVVQRESTMESNLYDGQLTIIAHLTDIRINDIVDFSYTITGSNPAYKGKYNTAFPLKFNVPVEYHRYSIIASEEDDITFKKLHGADEPEIEKRNNEIRYTWTGKKLQAKKFENNTPVWYDDTPIIIVSQFKTWREVSSLLNPSYRLDEESSNKLKNQINSLLPDATDQKDFIEKSIHFVQDEIRYLGFENGHNALIPRKPSEVLERRFGDCKDKSFLLSEILQTRGIDANPILVHSYNGRNLPEYLPSPDIFDHCVVQIDLGKDGIYYVDPTLSEQGGNLETIYFPDYKNGLLLKPEQNGLTELPKPETFKTTINETFEILSIGGGAKLDVVTIYKGNSADLRRRQFLNTNMQVLQQDYTNFYTSLYPSITLRNQLTFEDEREQNIFKVIESYHIDSLWTKPDVNQNLIAARFYPLALEPVLYPEQSGERETPYNLDPDSKIKQHTTVYFPLAWNIRNEKRNFNNQYFQYREDIKYKNATLEITHDYTPLKDHVAPQDIKSFLKEHSKIQNGLNYFAQYNEEAMIASENDSTSWLALLVMFLLISGSGVICYLIYYNYDLPSEVKPKYERKIGGWLVFIGFGLAMTPLMVLFQIMSSNYFTRSVWISLFSSNDTILTGILLLAEMIFNSVEFVFSIFVVVLFFQRRTIAPRMIIALYAGVLVLTGITTFSSLQLLPNAFSGAETQQLYTNLTIMAIRCLIFIPYFLYSERVEETFTKTRKKNLKKEKEESENVMEPEQVLVQ